MEDRSRLSRGSLLEHTLQVHPIMGMPPEVPDPNTLIIKPLLFAAEFRYKNRVKFRSVPLQRHQFCP